MIDKDFWDCPEEWDMKYFSEITSTISGKSFDSDNFVNNKSENTSPLIKVKHVDENQTDCYTTQDYEDKYVVNPGDLLVGMDGNFRAAFWNGRESALNQRVLKVENEDCLNIKFLKLWLDIVLPKIHDRVPKSTVKHLSVDDHLAPSIVPLPPLDEQERIVEEIEERFDTIDNLEQSVKNLKQLTTEYEKSLRLSLFTNKDEDDNISSEIKNKDIPDNWELKRVSEVVESKNGGTPKKSNSEYWEGEIDWLSSGEIEPKRLSSSEDSITEKAIEETSAKIFPKNSVLVAMYGSGTRGSSAILDRKMSGNQAICCLIPNRDIISEEYLFYFYQSIKDKLSKKARGSTQDNLNQTMVINEKIPIPPLDEQKRIVEEIERIDMSLVDKSLDDVEELFDEYRDSVLDSAFRGEMTNDDREEDISISGQSEITEFFNL